jgi:phospholipid/cholesterol/gamma-HCH transport system substrate-binding protein
METRAPYVMIGLFVLAVAAAGFGFVYWLHNTGGLSERTVYQVRFENTVSGLLTGAAVLFNGIRVGEVTALDLDAADPQRVTATIAVAASTPVRADTKAGLDFQGLTGVPVVTLQGGSVPLDRGAGPPGKPPILVADPLAGQSMTSAARDALRRLDTILSDNAEPIRGTIANLNTFSGALARNSDRLDGIVKGLERMTGGAAAAGPAVVFNLTAPKIVPPIDRPSAGPLVVAEPTALIMFETRKFIVRPTASEDPSFVRAEWSDSVPKLLQAKIIETFENAGLMREVMRPTDGVTAEKQLLIDIRKFQITLSPEPMAEIEFAARIMSDDNQIAGARRFEASAPLKAPDATAAAIALDAAFAQSATELVRWTAGLL